MYNLANLSKEIKLLTRQKKSSSSSFFLSCSLALACSMVVMNGSRQDRVHALRLRRCTELITLQSLITIFFLHYFILFLFFRLHLILARREPATTCFPHEFSPSTDSALLFFGANFRLLPCLESIILAFLLSFFFFPLQFYEFQFSLSKLLVTESFLCFFSFFLAEEFQGHSCEFARP